MQTCFKKELKDKYQFLQSIYKNALPEDKEVILRTLKTIESNLVNESIPGSIDILLELDYKELISSQFLWKPIKELARIKEPEETKQALNKLNLTLKDIMDLLHDFFKLSTPKNIYEIFEKVYKENKKSIRYINGENIDYSGEIIYLEYLKKFYIMGTKNNTLYDIMIFAHEFGHTIQFSTNYNPTLFNELNIYIEIISIFFELICNEHFIKGKFSKEANLNSYLTLSKYTESIQNVFSELTLLDIIKIKNGESNDILRQNIDELIALLSKENINNIMNLRPARDYIYVIAYYFATNHFMIYKTDPEYAFYLVNKIMNLDLCLSKEEYFKRLQDIGITDVNKTKEYHDLILTRYIKTI